MAGPNSFGYLHDPNVDFNSSVTNTTKGDLTTFSTREARIGAGSNASLLTVDDSQLTGLKWTPAMTTKGDIFVFDGANLAIQPVGADDTVLVATSTELSGVEWKTFQSQLPLTSKGDILSSTGVITGRLSVGTNHSVMTAASAETLGLKWDSVALTHDLGDGTTNLMCGGPVAAPFPSILAAAANNLVVGTTALDAITSGGNNVIIGNGCCATQTTASGNTVVGSSAATTLTGGSNVVVGADAFSGAGNTGANNVVLGSSAGTTNVTGDNCSYIGANTSATNGVDGCIAIGEGATCLVSNTMVIGSAGTPIAEILPGVTNSCDLGSDTVAFKNAHFTGIVDSVSYESGGVTGFIALQKVATSLTLSDNTHALMSGVGNCIFGITAGESITSGADNVCIGSLCARLMTTGFRNVFIGQLSGGDLTTSNVSAHVYVGYRAGQAISSGSSNTGIGYESLKTISTGSLNTCLGFRSSSSEIDAIGQTAIGYNTITTGDYSIALGYNTVSTLTRQLMVGSTGATSIQSWCPGVNNDTTLGTATFRFSELFSVNATINTSDLRKKIVYSARPPGIEFICKLTPIQYRWKENDNGTHFGFGAQHIEDLIEEGVVPEWSGFVKTPSDGDYSYGLRMTEFVAPIVQALQDVHNELQETKSEVVELKKMVLRLFEKQM
jgi:hypothetical protein